MDVKNSLALKKKRELLGGINKRKMSLRKHLDNHKQNEFRLDITQVTKCVFLGSLCLKPVPQLFDSPLLLEELDMKVGNVRDISVNNENDGSPNGSSAENQCVTKESTKKISRRKCLNVPKKKSLRERNDTSKSPPGVERVIKHENTSGELRPDITKEVSVSPIDHYIVPSPPTPPSILGKVEPCVNEPTSDYDTENNNDMGNMKQTHGVIDLDEVTPMDQIPNESQYDFEDIEFEDDLLDIKLNHTGKQSNEPTPGIVPADIKTISTVTLHYEDMVRMKREPTPELILSDSDDDTLDQLMFNIMDIKVNPTDFEKNFFDLPSSGTDEYNDYSDECNPKEDPLGGTDCGKIKEKKYLKRTPQCKICSKVFPNYIQLKKHKAAHNGDKPYLCLKCNENHTTLDQLIAHLRTHQGKRPYVCKKCNKGFKTTKALENHQPVHVLKKADPQKKAFKCEVCGKEFRKLCDLERHTRVHTGEKPSVCNICNKRFQQAHNLNKHLLIHTKEKPFECDICNKKFGRNDVLNRHLLTHSVRKPNDCNICMKSFIRVSQLLAHKKKYHSKQAS